MYVYVVWKCRWIEAAFSRQRNYLNRISFNLCKEKIFRQKDCWQRRSPMTNGEHRSHELLIFVPKISPWRIFKHPFVVSWDIQKYHQPKTKKLTIINFDSCLISTSQYTLVWIFKPNWSKFDSFSYLDLNSS